MKTSIQILVILCALLLACKEESVTKSCGTLATVRDLSGLDGCGWVFELSNGTRLVPEIIGYCGSPPPSKEMIDNNPLYDFQFVDGKKVFIGYTSSSNHANGCMVGTPVKINCLEEINSEEK